MYLCIYPCMHAWHWYCRPLRDSSLRWWWAHWRSLFVHFWKGYPEDIQRHDHGVVFAIKASIVKHLHELPYGCSERLNKRNKQTLINRLNVEVLDARSDGDEISAGIGETAVFEDFVYDGISFISHLLSNLSVLPAGNRSHLPLITRNKIKLPGIQWNLWIADTYGTEQECPLLGGVRYSEVNLEGFHRIGSQIVCPLLGGVRYSVCPLFRGFTVQTKPFSGDILQRRIFW